MKILVFVDHDIICRHFLLNGALTKLAEAHNVRFIFQEGGGKRLTLDPATIVPNGAYERLPIDARRQQMWRWLLYAEQLRPQRGAHEAAIRRMRRMTLGWKPWLLLTVAGLPGISTVFRWWITRLLNMRPNQELAELFERERPDAILHPTVLDGVFVNDVIQEGRRGNIPVIFVMNSWDNPSTKRAMVGKPDWLLVWGEQTKRHAVRFMQLDGSRVIPFGAAQFDVFFNPPRLTRSEFCASYGIDPANKIMLFAGSNAQTDEYSVLVALDRAISEGQLSNISIVYRPHPWGAGGHDGQRFARADFNNVVIDRTMRAYLARVASRGYGISLPDYHDTHDLISVVDAVISPLSTILLEAALHGKPVLVFTPMQDGHSEILVNNLPLLHFSEFVELPDVGHARSVAELISWLSEMADGTTSVEAGTRARNAVESLVTTFSEPWRFRIVDFLETVMERRRARNWLVIK